MFFSDRSDSVVMDSLARGNKERPVAVYCDFLEMWDTEKARLVQLWPGFGVSLLYLRDLLIRR
jgi:hypothetical protein